MSGFIDDCETSLANTLGALSSVQTWMGVNVAPAGWDVEKDGAYDDADKLAAALARIHRFELPSPAGDGEYTAAELAAYRPYVILTTKDSELFSNAKGAAFVFGPPNVVIAAMFVKTISSYDESSVYKAATSSAGAVMEECAVGVLGAGGKYAANGIAFRGVGRFRECERLTGIGEAYSFTIDFIKGGV